MPYGFQFADEPEHVEKNASAATKSGQTDRKDTEDQDD
jgi:hypothetical protein